MGVRVTPCAVRGLSLLLVGLLSPAARADAPSFRGLGSLRPGEVSDAYDVSDDGTVVVGSSNTQSTGEAFRWTAAGGMEGLGFLPGRGATSVARAVSGDGTTIVGDSGTAADGQTRAFRWTGATGMVAVPPLGAPDSLSLGMRTSKDGSVVVGYGINAANDVEAFRWSATAGSQGLGFVPAGGYPNSNATAITPDGSVISGNSGFHAARWTQATGWVPLGDVPGSTYSNVAGISADGSAVVGTVVTSRSGTGEAYRWTESRGMQLLRDAPVGGKEYATDVTDDGLLVVGNAQFGAFVWDEKHGMRDLRAVLVDEYGLGSQLEGWTLGIAYAISADGRAIVGTGNNPQHVKEAFLVILPEPAAPALLLAGASLLLSRAGRRRDRRCPRFETRGRRPFRTEG